MIIIAVKMKLNVGTWVLGYSVCNKNVVASVFTSNRVDDREVKIGPHECMCVLDLCVFLGERSEV